MCDPVTLTVVATATAAVGTIYSGVQQSRMQRYNAGVARNNAVYAQREADDALERGRKEEIKHYQALARMRGEQQAAFAAGGLDTSFGSPLDIIGDTAALGNADAQTIRTNAAREAQGYVIQAQGFRDESRALKSAARSTMISTGLGVASTLLGGAQQVQGAIGKYGKPGWMSRSRSSPSTGWAGALPNQV